jgi:hypothetical protein
MTALLLTQLPLVFDHVLVCTLHYLQRTFDSKIQQFKISRDANVTKRKNAERWALCKSLILLVAGGGIEPPTLGL